MYLNNLEPGLSVSENICKHVLASDGFFRNYGKNILPEELRELSVYNTILQALASGKKKLNDLYKLTGFDRAKISVYLKNLIDLKLVEKIDENKIKKKQNTIRFHGLIKERYFRL